MMMNDREKLLKSIEVKKEIERRKIERGDLLAYTKWTFPKYQVNWHHKLICKYLDKFIKKEIRRLMIFAPPRHGKSELTSRRLPSYLHGLYPNDEILAVSYNSELASDMTIDVQRILQTPEFKELFPTVGIDITGRNYAKNRNEHEIMPYQDPKDKLWHWYTGSYKSAGVGGSFTGRGGDWVLIDDPIKNREDADSRSFRESLWKFYTSTIRTRLEGEASILITLTRWHDDDLASRLLRLAQQNPEADQWTVLTLPAVRDDFENPEDPRLIGEPLWPGKFSAKELLKMKAMNSRDWSSLWQQHPTVEGGNIIQSKWIKYYTSLPERFDQMIQSWDFAVKDKSGSDYTVGQVWGRKGASKYLLYQVRGRFSFPIACEKVLEVSKLYPQSHKKLIEAKANGPAIIQTLRQRISGLVEVEPRGDKLARLNAVAPEYESGNVYYPHESIPGTSWVKDHLKELCDFPASTNDDQVDTATQALDELRKASTLYLPISGHSGVVF